MLKLKDSTKFKKVISAKDKVDSDDNSEDEIWNFDDIKFRKGIQKSQNPLLGFKLDSPLDRDLLFGAL